MSDAAFAILGIDHVQLAAPEGCEDAARYFYGTLLGFTEVSKPPELVKRGGVWFQVGAQALHIGVETPFGAARKAHPALLVRNLDVLAQQLERTNVNVIWDAALPGYRRFYAADP